MTIFEVKVLVRVSIILIYADLSSRVPQTHSKTITWLFVVGWCNDVVSKNPTIQSMGQVNKWGNQLTSFPFNPLVD